MPSIPNIAQVIIEDKENAFYDKEDFQRYAPGGIILGASKDDEVHYEWFDGILKREENSTLFLDNYHGKIFIPKHCGLQILDSNRSISGFVNFPAYLDSYDQVSIMIDKESGLELLASTLGELKVNGKEIKKLVEGITEAEAAKVPRMVGRSFDEYEERYTKKNTTQKPKIIKDACGIIADFGSIEEYSLAQICIKYNLVVIEADIGDIQVYYDGFIPNREKQQFRTQKGIRRLEHDLQEAQNNQKYEMACTIRDRLNALYQRTGKKVIRPEQQLETVKVEKIEEIIKNHKSDSNLQK